MGRSSGAQSVEQKSEACLRCLRIYAQKRQDLSLQRRIVDADAASAELESVQHDVIRKRADLFRRGVEKRDVFRVRRCEWMVHRAERTILLADEQREIGNP